jgi:hypothetical protein
VLRIPAVVFSVFPRDHRFFSADPVAFEIGEDLFGTVGVAV